MKIKIKIKNENEFSHENKKALSPFYHKIYFW